MTGLPNYSDRSKLISPHQLCIMAHNKSSEITRYLNRPWTKSPSAATSSSFNDFVLSRNLFEENSLNTASPSVVIFVEPFAVRNWQLLKKDIKALFPSKNFDGLDLSFGTTNTICPKQIWTGDIKLKRDGQSHNIVQSHVLFSPWWAITSKWNYQIPP